MFSTASDIKSNYYFSKFYSSNMPIKNLICCLSNMMILGINDESFWKQKYRNIQIWLTMSVVCYSNALSHSCSIDAVKIV